MDKEFIKNITKILQDYLSVKNILASSSQKTIKDLEKVMIKQLLDESISVSKREDILANFISRYLNNTKIFNYDLKSFNRFHNEINTIFSEKGYYIREEEIPYNSGYIHTVVTPSYSSHMEEVDAHWKDMEDYHKEEMKTIIEESDKYKKIVSEKNQNLIIELINNYNIYLKLIKNHFDGVEIDLANEKEFVSTIQKIRSFVDSLHLGSIVDRYNLKKIIPFTSLLSLEQDWNFEIKSQRKKILLEEKEDIKSLEFSFDNIKSRVMEEISRINKYIDYSKINNPTPTEEELVVKTISGSLVVNNKTGEIQLGKKKISISPSSDIFEILSKIAKGNGTYEELGYVSKSKKIDLAQHIKTLKHQLGILPKKDSENLDIFKNNKGHSYVIIKDTE